MRSTRNEQELCSWSGRRCIWSTYQKLWTFTRKDKSFLVDSGCWYRFRAFLHTTEVLTCRKQDKKWKAQSPNWTMWQSVDHTCVDAVDHQFVMRESVHGCAGVLCVSQRSMEVWSSKLISLKTQYKVVSSQKVNSEQGKILKCHSCIGAKSINSINIAADLPFSRHTASIQRRLIFELEPEYHPELPHTHTQKCLFNSWIAMWLSEGDQRKCLTSEAFFDMNFSVESSSKLWRSTIILWWPTSLSKRRQQGICSPPANAYGSVEKLKLSTQ